MKSTGSVALCGNQSHKFPLLHQWAGLPFLPHTRTHTHNRGFPSCSHSLSHSVCVAPGPAGCLSCPINATTLDRGCGDSELTLCLYLWGLCVLPDPLRYSASICLLSALRMCIITPGTTRVQWNIEHRDSLTHFIYSLLAPSCRSRVILELSLSLKSNFL